MELRVEGVGLLSTELCGPHMGPPPEATASSPIRATLSDRGRLLELVEPLPCGESRSRPIHPGDSLSTQSVSSSRGLFPGGLETTGAEAGVECWLLIADFPCGGLLTRGDPEVSGYHNREITIIDYSPVA